MEFRRFVNSARQRWSQITWSSARVFAFSFCVLLALRFVFGALTVQYHMDGDNTVSLLQANDWQYTPHREYFWAQDYMGTTEVWLFGSLWRLFARAGASIPLLYWMFCAQLLSALGAALVLTGLVFTDRAFWGRPGVYAISFVVFGLGIPVFQKYTFGVGHGYSAGPFYAGLTIAGYLFRERLSAPLFFALGLVLGQSHYIFRLHILFPAALALSLLAAGPRKHVIKLLTLVLGTALGTLPEHLQALPQGQSAAICLTDPQHTFLNVWTTLLQLGVHLGTLPYSLVESEHALWFASHRSISELCIFWGERIGAVLFLVLLVMAAKRSLRSQKYLIFLAIFALNFCALGASCLALDQYGSRRYMYLSNFPIAFLVLCPPWTFVQRSTIVLRCATLAVYAVSALMFSTPLAQFAKQSKALHFDRKQDCIVGTGGDLSPLIAFNRINKVQTIDLDWRLRSNYSRDVPANRNAVREHCRQIFWIDSRGHSDKPVRKLCKLQSPFYEDVPHGIVEYPQRVRFMRCLVPGHPVP